jgi:hypothetical protein
LNLRYNTEQKEIDPIFHYLKNEYELD